MKIGTWGKASIFIFAIGYFSFSFSSYYRTPRQLNRMAIRVGRQHNKIRQNQQKLLRALKESAFDLKAKPGTLHSIATAIGNKTRFKPFLKEQKTIEQSIDNFHKIPGFLSVFSRLFEGAVYHDKANFNGAIAELQVALSKSKEGKKITEFNRIIRDSVNNKTITEIDIITEDNEGHEQWHEVKSSNRAEKNNQRIANQEQNQRNAAAAHGVCYEKIIVSKKS